MKVVVFGADGSNREYAGEIVEFEESKTGSLMVTVQDLNGYIRDCGMYAVGAWLIAKVTEPMNTKVYLAIRKAEEDELAKTERELAAKRNRELTEDLRRSTRK